MNKIKATSVIAVVLALAAFNVRAEETTPVAPTTEASQSTTKIEDVKEKNKVEGNIDEEITNARMRADSGSKSKWSGSADLQYLGGTIRKPLDKDRANPSHEAVPEKVNLLGALSVRYRLNQRDSLKAGTGVSMTRPLQEARKGNVSDPYLGFGSAYKIGDIQNVTDLSVTAATDSDERKQGMVGYLGAVQTAVTDFHGSKFTAGLVLETLYFGYDKNSAALQEGQEEIRISPYPFAEYALSDMFQLRTLFRPWMFRHFRGQTDTTKFVKMPWTQSVGLTIVATRDIYFYPNFQWDVTDWANAGYNLLDPVVANNTTVGVSATMNVF